MKRKTILCLCIILLLCACLDVFKIMLLRNRMRNPYLVEIQEQMEEAGIQGLRIEMSYNNDVITGISVEGEETFYESEENFYEVDKVQKIITSYVCSHPDVFIMDYEKDAGVLYSGFSIAFYNSDAGRGNTHGPVFCFNQVDEKLREGAKGMNRVIISGTERYKISCLFLFPNIKEFNCWEMVLDDEDVLNKLPNTKRINLYGVLGINQKTFIEKAKKKGIVVESADLPQKDGDTNYD